MAITVERVITTARAYVSPCRAYTILETDNRRYRINELELYWAVERLILERGDDPDETEASVDVAIAWGDARERYADTDGCYSRDREELCEAQVEELRLSYARKVGEEPKRVTLTHRVALLEVGSSLRDEFDRQR